MNQEHVSFLALCDLRGVGFETLKRVYAERLQFSSFFDPQERLRLSNEDTLRTKFSRILEVLNTEAARDDALRAGRRKLEYFEQRGIHLIFRNDNLYPKRLSDLQDPPHWLFVEGRIDALQSSAVAAIGSRKVSADGKWLATYFGYCLKDLNVVTVSGLAEGIDQIVHRASLAAGLPMLNVIEN